VLIAEFVPDNQKIHCKHDTQLIGDSKITAYATVAIFKTYDSLSLNVTTTMHVMQKSDDLLETTTLKQEIFNH
jgi:hypothetical protein